MNLVLNIFFDSSSFWTIVFDKFVYLLFHS